MSQVVPYKFTCEACGLELALTAPWPETEPGECPVRETGRHYWLRLDPTIHIALHEAAHAVVAARLGFKVLAVRLRRDESYITRVLDAPCTPQSMIKTLAGEHGQRLAGVEPDGQEDDVARFRTECAEWLALGLIGDLRVGYVAPERWGRMFGLAVAAAEADFQSDAALIVQDSEEQIRTLADILVQERDLEGRALEEALSSAGASADWAGALTTTTRSPDYRETLWNRVAADTGG